MATRIDATQSEFTRGVLAALNEAKTIALAHATLAGVLAGPDVANTLLISFNAILDPLIEKHSPAVQQVSPVAPDAPHDTSVFAVVEKVISITRQERGSVRVDVIAMNFQTGDSFPHSRTFRSFKNARKFRPGTAFTFKPSPVGDFDDGVPF
ncbi:hypothetical protein DMO35_13515 [Salmonella enterica subsp. enterica serovar Reading]|uniref:hypothetical protein n=1 Tax=Citrobacter freundii TaxID=546 RepID=UPI0012753663|nr:hypothetical protein [Salmonella enterica subsp. enterica serovar Reading]EBX6584804.1 hypothetical protein [Salmonella enterica subsp. enterica serovar Newport]EBZ2757562.1 hypothetical protein [Salmonella enterica subsp. enterica serovar Pomona]ECI3935338.1 hypothetical protein [Salmonella enterica subsp. enterica]ECW0299485.1 hypothetical protein [Salmonella enterica subsp. enterica serovar Newport]